MGEPKDDDLFKNDDDDEDDPAPANFNDALTRMQDRLEEHKDQGFGTAYRLSGEAKVAGALEFLDTLFEAGAKFLLFAHHLGVMD